MKLPSIPAPSLRLPSRGWRASSPVAGVVSLAVHAGLVALAAVGAARWRPPALLPVAAHEAPGPTVGYVVLGLPSVQSGEPARPETAAKPTPKESPAAPARLRVTHSSLFSMTPTVAVTTTDNGQPGLREGPPEAVSAPPAPETTSRRAGSVRAKGAGNADLRRGVGQVSRGPTRVAELLTRAGMACPTLRRPSSGDRNVVVAVEFVVDVSGAVDRRTLRVVQSPATPPSTPEYYPHIYVVGTTAQVDGALPSTTASYSAVLARDVLRHVATLRFRPALQNGRPARSRVLVSCQAA